MSEGPWSGFFTTRPNYKKVVTDFNIEFYATS
jgi:hypothetical protein